jgi:excisionase family DNA binding protein
MQNQTEGNNLLNGYQPGIAAFVNEFLTLLTNTVKESVNDAAQNIFHELNRQKEPAELNKVADGFLTRVQVAELLNISIVTLFRYQKEGLIPYRRIGRRILFNRSEVLEAIKITTKKKGGKL